MMIEAIEGGARNKRKKGSAINVARPISLDIATSIALKNVIRKLILLIAVGVARSFPLSGEQSFVQRDVLRKMQEEGLMKAKEKLQRKEI